MQRPEMLSRVRARTEPWDMVVVGGGATGVGVAVDAAARGYAVLLLEQHDFGKGTSSRSTKLVHGGVRYLEQGNISLVMEALKERGMLRQNAPHLVRDLAFVVPNYDWWEAPFYGLGLKVYNLLSGKYGFGPSKILSREKTLELLGGRLLEADDVAALRVHARHHVLDRTVLARRVHRLHHEQHRPAVLRVQLVLHLGEPLDPLLQMPVCVALVERARVAGVDVLEPEVPAVVDAIGTRESSGGSHGCSVSQFAGVVNADARRASV